MTRYLPLLLAAWLTSGGLVQANDGMPTLESRVGRTITVVEAQKPNEKAMITHVWRLADGSPVMQAKSLATGLQMTIVENPKATTVAERIKVHRWTKEGVAPAGCPMMPVAKSAPVAPSAPPAAMKSGKAVATTEGGLLPVLTKKDEAKPVTTVAATQPAKPAPTNTPVANAPRSSVAVAKPESKPVMPVVKSEPKQMPTMAKTAPSMPAAPSMIKPAQAVVVAQPAPAGAAVVAPKPHLVGGREVITITENGKPRQFMIVGQGTNANGVMLTRCQAMDNGEIVTLNCGNCGTNNCAPVCPPVKCEPVKPCPPPVVVKTMPPPPQVAKVEPAKPPVMEKVTPPPPPVAKTEPCPPVCDTKCAPVCDDRKLCKDDCDRHGRRGKRVKCDDDVGMINVPVPGVALGSAGFPSCPPPQPLVPSFCTANSTSVRCALASPLLVPLKCMYQPFTPCMNATIATGIGLAAKDPMEAEAIQNTLYLVNVMQTSREWENRQWAADRLVMASLPTLKPYVEDCLMAAAQYDRAPHVKASAIRTLAVLKPMRPDLMGLFAQSMGDPHPMVQQAAGQAIESLMKGSMQQAGYQK